MPRDAARISASDRVKTWRSLMVCRGFGWTGDFPLGDPDQTLDFGFWGPVGISEGEYGLILKEMGSLYSLTAAINAGMPTRLIARRKL